MFRVLGLNSLVCSILLLTSPAFAQSEGSGGAGAPADQGADCQKPSERLARSEKENGGYLDKECIEATRLAEDCCLNPNQEKCGSKPSNFGVKEQPAEEKKISGIHQPAVNQAKDLTQAYNRNRANASLCGTQNERRYKVCKTSADKRLQAYRNADPGAPLTSKEVVMKAAYASEAYLRDGDADLSNYQSCHQRQASKNRADLEQTVDTANESAGEGMQGSWRVACVRTRIGDENSEQCALLNTGDADGKVVSGADRDKLPVTSVPLGNCSGYTDESGVLHTASHCPNPQSVTAIRYSEDEPQTNSWRKGTELPFDDEKFKAGQPYNDQRSMTPVGDRVNGKPFYTLSEDRSLTSGCEARGQVLACSPAALNSIQGQTAQIQGYPAEQFGTTGTLNSKTDTLVTSGPAYYDPYSKRVIVGAYAAPGNSGGAVFLKEGSDIGGYVADRPVVVGPNSGAMMSDNQGYANSDRLALVPISSTADVQRLTVPSVSSQVLQNGGAVFLTPSAPTRQPTARGRRR